MPYELPAEKLRLECDTKQVNCETTKEMPLLEEIVGQERALKALRFGLGIKERGFNIYVAGLPGSGRTTAVKDFLEEMAKDKPVPGDWCYINNFSDPFVPIAIRLPAGRGKEFQKDIKSFIEEVRRALPKVFESEDYTSKREDVIGAVEGERKELLSRLNERAREEGFALESSPVGVLIIPVIEGKPVSDQELMALPAGIRDEIEKKREELSRELRNAFRQLRSMERQVSEEIQKLNREVAIYAIGHLVDTLMEKYGDVSEVRGYIESVRNDILEDLAIFISEPKEVPQLPFPASWMRELPFRKYEVNIIVDNSGLHGAPVIMELNPIYQNLFGRIEKEAQFGVLTTDFTMIRGGSLHNANGGYLVLPIEEVIRNIFSYESLKRSLQNAVIAIEEAGERLGFITTKGLRPEPIPLDVKVILIGSPLIYQQLYLLDADFKELFKVKADFDTTMDRTDENIRKYASFICTLCEKEKLRHLDASGVAKVVEYGSRLAEDQKKLSVRFGEVADIVREASLLRHPRQL